jgi:hypothetical protein
MVLAELGDHPRVRHSVYVAALWPQKGQSVGDLFGGQFPDWMTVRADGAVRVASEAEVVREALCQDVDRHRFVADIFPRYVLTSISSLGAPSTAPTLAHAPRDTTEGSLTWVPMSCSSLIELSPR